MTYNGVLISAVQQSDSVIHIYSLSYSFPYGLSQDIEYSSLCYTVGHATYTSLHQLISNSLVVFKNPFLAFLSKNRSYGNNGPIFLCGDKAVKPESSNTETPRGPRVLSGSFTALSPRLEQCLAHGRYSINMC